MNQAAKLESWAKERERKTIGIAWLSTRNVTGVQSFLEMLAFSSMVEAGDKVLVTDETESRSIKQVLSPRVTFETGFFRSMESGEYRAIAESVREREKLYTQFWHYAGFCLDAKPLSIGCLAQKIVLIAAADEQAVRDVAKVVQFLDSKKVRQPVLLITDTENKEVHREQLILLHRLTGGISRHRLEDAGYAPLSQSRYMPVGESLAGLDIGGVKRREDVGYASHIERCFFKG